SSEDAGEITNLLGVATAPVTVDASAIGTGEFAVPSMTAAQFNAISPYIVKIADDGISGTFTITKDVNDVGAILEKTQVAATVTVNAFGMTSAQLDDVGANSEKVDFLVDVTVVAAGLSLESLEELLANSTDVLVIATDMSADQLNLVAEYAANVQADGITGSVFLTSAVTDTTLAALLGKVAESATVTADATGMTSIHKDAMAADIDVVDEIYDLALASSESAAEITALLSKSVATASADPAKAMAVADATDMLADQLTALGVSYAKLADDGITGSMLLVAAISDDNITNLFLKTALAATVRVDAASMNATTLAILVVNDLKVDTIANLQLTSDTTAAQMGVLFTKADPTGESAPAASALVDATGMDSNVNGQLATVADNYLKIASGGISGAIVINANLTGTQIGNILSRLAVVTGFIGTTVSIDAAGMDDTQLASIAASVNSIGAEDATSIFAVENLTVTENQSAGELTALLAVTEPGEAVIDATGMDAAQLSTIATNPDGIGAITGIVDVTAGVSAEAIAEILNTQNSSGATINIDPTGFDEDQQDAFDQALQTQAVYGVGASLPNAVNPSLTSSTVYVKAGETVAFFVEASNLGLEAAAAQGRINYDSSRLTFVSVEAGPDMPTLFAGTDGVTGTQRHVTFYTGIAPDAEVMGITDGIVAKVLFTATSSGFCKASDLVSLNTSFSNRLVSAGATPATIPVIGTTVHEVSALRNLLLAGVPSGEADVDGGANISMYADAGTVAGTVYADPMVTAANNCEDYTVDIDIVYPDTSVGTTWPARFPVGTSRVTWSVMDQAGNVDVEVRDIVVINKQLATIDVDLAGGILGSASFTQDVRVRLSSGDIVTASVVFSGGNGAAMDIEIPVRDDYTCVTVKDAVHTLADAQTLVVDAQGRKYEASGTFSLVAGDANDDNVVDILDFGAFIYDRGVAKLATDRSNYNRDAFVNNADFTFIGLNFLFEGDTCGGFAQGGNGPMARVKVKDLRRMGLGHLAIADFNGDGWIDETDMALALEGADPVMEEVETPKMRF
ncbi:MAG: hypothetical protein RI967_2459, partial [Planctomycetota bacterium]